MTTVDQSLDAAARTRLLLRAGVMAGPLYLTVGLVQGLTRPGFDLARHSLSLLSNGSFGWIQIANFIVSGALVVAAAMGLREANTGSRVAAWLVAVFGLGMIGGGIFIADPMDGFPPGTPSGPPVSGTLSGMLHFAVGGVGFICVSVACLVYAVRFARTGHPTLAVSSVVAAVLFLGGFAGLASGRVSATTILAFWIGLAAIFAWLAAVSTHFSRRLAAPSTG